METITIQEFLLMIESSKVWKLTRQENETDQEWIKRLKGELLESVKDKIIEKFSMQ